MPLREQEISEFQKTYRVVNISKKDDMILLRTISDTKPMQDSIGVAPTLEDYYLSVFGERFCH